MPDLKGWLAKVLGINAQTTTLRNPAPWFLDLLGSSDTASGVRASQSVAYSLAAYFCGVRIISETIGSLPLNVYRRIPGPREGRQVASSHPVHFLLHREPNREMSSMVWRETLVAHAIDWGNAYCEIERDSSGTPVNLWPLDPRSTTPKRQADQSLWYETWVDGQRYMLPAANVLHIPGLGYDGRLGYGLIQLAAETMGLNAAARDYSGRFFRNGGHVSMVAETDAHLDDEAFARLQSQIRTNIGGLSNAHRIALLEYGVKLRATNMSHEDAQMIESMKFSIEEWARWFNIPPHKLKDLTNAHFTNIEHQNLEWVGDTVRPWCVRFEQEFDRKLFFQKQTFYTKHVLEGLLRGDLKSRYDAYAIARNWGWLSANDIRELEDLNPLPGDTGDQYLIPLNMGLAERAGEEPPQPEPQPDEAEPDSNRERQMVESAARRVANYERRRLENESTFMVYNDGGLEQRVERWLITNEDIAGRYRTLAENLNILASEQGIDADALTEAKVKLLTELILNHGVSDETLCNTAFS